MPLTDSLQSSIDATCSEPELRRNTYAEAMLSLCMSAAKKVVNGLIPVNEVLYATL